MEIDSKQLILEVAKYPCIYKIKDTRYNKSPAKIKAWKRIMASLVGEELNLLSQQEQTIYGLAIQKKWKALKDAFLRSIKTSEGTRDSGTIRKKYRYYNQMSFLLKPSKNECSDLYDENMSYDETNSYDEIIGYSVDNISHDGNIKDDKNTYTEEEIHAYATEEPECPLLVIKKEIETTDFDSELVPNPSTPEEEDSDRMFLLSLLKPLQSLSPKQSMKFKIKTLTLLEELKFPSPTTTIQQVFK